MGDFGHLQFLILICCRTAEKEKLLKKCFKKNIELDGQKLTDWNVLLILAVQWDESPLRDLCLTMRPKKPDSVSGISHHDGQTREIHSLAEIRSFYQRNDMVRCIHGRQIFFRAWPGGPGG
jgi:hypothetical protein